MNKPLVSISCITYNHSKFIKECLDGFLMQQTDFGFEVLIHDDASTDGTQDIIKAYQEKYPDIIKPIFQTENQYSKGVRGINAKFNYSRAQGKYIALCEGDDYWTDPLKLQKQVNFLEENGEYSLCSHNYSVINERGGVLKSKVLDVFTKEKTYISKLDLMKKVYPMLTLTLCFRNIFTNKTYPIEGTKVLNGDSFLISLMGQFGKACHLDFIGAAYRKHLNGVSSSIPLIEKNKRSYFFAGYMANYYRPINEEVANHYFSKKEKYILRLIDFSKKTKRLKEIFSILKLALGDSGFTIPQKINFLKRAVS